MGHRVIMVIRESSKLNSDASSPDFFVVRNVRKGLLARVFSPACICLGRFFSLWDDS